LCLINLPIKNNKKEKSLFEWGILGALVASACCWLPLLLIFLGLINISTALTIGYYSIYFLITGLALTGLALYFYWRKNGKTCCTTKTEFKKHLLISIIVVLAVLFFSYVIKNFIAPTVAPFVYEQFSNR